MFLEQLYDLHRAIAIQKLLMQNCREVGGRAWLLLLLLLPRVPPRLLLAAAGAVGWLHAM
jgi:hypothetical protein